MNRRGALVLATTVAVAAALLWRLRPDSGPHPDTPLVEPRAIARLGTWVPTPPASRLGRVAGYLWAAPLTAAGVALGALSCARPQVRDGALIFTEVQGLGGRMLRWRGFTAATLGHAVLTARVPSERLLRHELVHVRQAERLGPLFVPLYVAGLIRYGYRRNPFERAAYAATDDQTGSARLA